MMEPHKGVEKICRKYINATLSLCFCLHSSGNCRQQKAGVFERDNSMPVIGTQSRLQTF